MKLSTAIRKGSKGRTQTAESLMNSDGAVCALGAACIGVGIKPAVGKGFSYKLLKMFPFLGKLTDNYTDNPQTLADHIVRFNDQSGWSFTRIANWLERKGY